MRIFYDYQIFQQQIYGGISRYFYELMKGIDGIQKSDYQYILPLVESSNAYITRIPSVAKSILSGSDYYHQFLGGIEFPGKWKLFQQWNKFFPKATLRNQLLTINALKNKDFDLFHPTDVNDYFLQHLGGRPFVVTIHDMIDEYFPEYLFHVHSTYKTSIKEKLVKKAAGIIAVSESTKQKIIERFNIDDRKIKVIYHGVSDFKDHSSSQLISGKYFLYIGKRTHYKNFYFFIQCVQSFLKEDPALKIVCTGSPFNKAELDYFSDLGVLNNISYIDADDTKLSNLYQHAIAFVYPSLHEGFGMPILEAFKNGCPTILSNTTSLPEVAGNAALYFDPKSIESVKTAIYQIINDIDLRFDLIQRGNERVKLFSWQKTIQETMSFYNAII